MAPKGFAGNAGQGFDRQPSGIRWVVAKGFDSTDRLGIVGRPFVVTAARLWWARNLPGSFTLNDNDPPPVTIITGRVFRKKGGRSEGVHVMLIAPDDDSAVRSALEALAREGYAEAELDQIGEMEGAPDEEPHASAYQGAVEGEVSIVTFEEDR